MIHGLRKVDDEWYCKKCEGKARAEQPVATDDKKEDLDLLDQPDGLEKLHRKYCLGGPADEAKKE